MAKARYSDITPEILNLTELCMKKGPLDPLCMKIRCKKGLAGFKGTGVLTGLLRSVKLYPNRR